MNEIIKSIKTDRIQFNCIQCGNCCSGATGYVWLTDTEQKNISDFLGIPLKDFKKKYTKKENLKTTLIEIKKNESDYRCIFLTEKNKCLIYDCRPHQCKTYPYWKKIIQDDSYLDYVKNDCPGIKIIIPKSV
ncbi:YkgJ family cysteine cluster protein [Candidatus Dependentiae bacterium]|nr:YkgJ family cysteine cluster protein [Candidatus Dependentiae bacterium]